MRDWQDIFTRAGKTFAQGFFGVAATLGAAGWKLIITDPKNAGAVFLIAATSAGLAALCSFVWNYLVPQKPPIVI